MSHPLPFLAGERPFAPVLPDLPPAAAAVALLRPGACRWPFGEPDGDTFTFCGATRLPRGSYCAVHARTARSGAAGRGRRA